MFFSYNRNVQLHGKVPKDDETQREGERQGERERGRERGRETETESVGRGGGGDVHKASVDPQCFINDVATVTTRMIPALR